MKFTPTIVTDVCRSIITCQNPNRCKICKLDVTRIHRKRTQYPMSSRGFASAASFGTPKRTPKQERSQMSLSELDEGQSQFTEATNDCLARIEATKADLNVLMLKTKSYTRNTGMSYHDVLTPTQQKRQDSYARSPFGKELQISDYSYTVTPTSSKSGKYRP